MLKHTHGRIISLIEDLEHLDYLRSFPKIARDKLQIEKILENKISTYQSLSLDEIRSLAVALRKGSYSYSLIGPIVELEIDKITAREFDEYINEQEGINRL